ncbi:hypothetical protein SAMN05444920_102217 [Nonomuraea solani]|uniref:Uncharacterized protein n=1 Tax=Nonomuraea solani TaxID=1144553 RepID=A0A1H5YBG4_9ACTN|nr:hypothetical protein [Nonomuraea solani]SEG21314.1 hypothetical protein SAMN05444920_102217 [Nonomuraea solani]
MQSVILNNGVQMPILGFGVFATKLWVQDNPAEEHTRRAFETSAWTTSTCT